jgi:hypothetical protein
LIDCSVRVRRRVNPSFFGSATREFRLLAQAVDAGRSLTELQDRRVGGLLILVRQQLVQALPCFSNSLRGWTHAFAESNLSMPRLTAECAGRRH